MTDPSQSTTAVPQIDGRYICIANRESVTLTAVISSYLFQRGFYIPLFLFPTVKFSRIEVESQMSDEYMANLLGNEARVLINNAWARMGGSEHVILAQLNEHQKSFWDFPQRTNIIEIADLSEVPSKLAPLLSGSRLPLKCKRADVLRGLCVALRQEKTLVIDDSAPDLAPLATDNGKGIVVIEMATDAATVVAINYASAVNANAVLVEPLAEREEDRISGRLEDWKNRGNNEGWRWITEAVNSRVGAISFRDFDYATFFTTGLPYSLVLKNCIPSSYAHLNLHPDLFIVNNILFESGDETHAAIVFSPLFFMDEETRALCDFLVRCSFFVRPLVGKQASLANFDFCAQHFPYDLLHICSHGGEVSGYTMTEEFLDSNGVKHTVEFDEVVGYSPVADDVGRVLVHRKMLPRRLDGYEWNTPELRRQGLANDVYKRMWACMRESDGVRKVKGKIPMSCSIACSDSIHQGQFHTLASHRSPIIYNNACWSWYEVSKFFLSCGARGYVGTLWAIDNRAAIDAARVFYTNLFRGTVLAAFHNAMKALHESSCRDIYAYWGLHFTTLRPGRTVEDSRQRVIDETQRSVEGWVRHILETKNPESKRNSMRVLKSILEDLRINFDEDTRTFREITSKHAPDIVRDEAPLSDENTSDELRASMDFPTTFKEKPKK